jgi:hypothetical protein
MSTFWWWGVTTQRKAKRRHPDYLHVNGTACRLVNEESGELVNPQGKEYLHMNADAEVESPVIAMSTPEASLEHQLDHIAATAMPPRLPKWVEKAILLLFPKKSREYLIGDLAEEYAEIASNHGVRFANFWYWKQVVASAWPFFMKALRWGLLASWVRRLI